MPNSASANTRILDAPTHARVNRQSTARPLIGINGIAPALLLSREAVAQTPSFPSVCSEKLAYATELQKLRPRPSTAALS